MRTHPQKMAGVVLRDPETHEDQRGCFVKLFSSSENQIRASQVCSSFNSSRGTLRGLHVQLAPHLERKALWCVSGEVFDVLVDIRPEQPTYGHWAGIHLRATEPQLLIVPPGVAHGFQTLTDAATINYLIEGEYNSESARTLRWDDPTVGIDWPLEVRVISEADRAGFPWPVS